MKKRYLYVLMFSVPALLASVVLTILLFGTAAGVLWLFVLGDNPWPSFANHWLIARLCLVCGTLWVTAMSVAYFAGKTEEVHATLNAMHVVASVGPTILLGILVVLHQWSVGNIGAKSDGLLCSEFCRDKGFGSSGMPPRNTGAATCMCFDAQGREGLRVPWSVVIAQRRK